MSARGGLPPKDAVEQCSEQSCCWASGMELKVFNSLAEVEGVEREVAAASAEQCLEALRMEYTKQGGCGNAVIERIFSLITY